MNYSAIKNLDVANGTGIRVSLFVSGCTHHCKGCFNPEAWDFLHGDPFTPEIEDQILAMLKPAYVYGLSLLGGEPFEPTNQAALLPFLRRVKAMYPDKTIWAYSGYNFEQDMLTGKLGPYEITHEILSMVNVLVDGEFVIELRNPSLKFRGSSNQRLIDVPASLKQDAVVLWDETSAFTKA